MQFLRNHIRKLLDVEAHFVNGQLSSDSVLVSKGNLIHYGLITIGGIMALLYSITNLLQYDSPLPAMLTFNGFIGSVIALLLMRAGKILLSKIFNVLQFSATIALSFFFSYEETTVHTNDSVVAFFIPVSIACLIAFQGSEKKIGYLLGSLVLLLMSVLLFTDMHYTSEHPVLTTGSQSPDIQFNMIGAGVACFAEVLYILLLSKRMDESLLKANRELDSFVYSVSHDLRSPLLCTRGMLDLASRKLDEPQDVLCFLKMADNSITKLDEIIKEILAYSRNARTGLQPELFNIRDLLIDIYSSYRMEAGPLFSFREKITGGSMVWADKGRLSTVLRNLIGNAVKYRKKDITDPFVFAEIHHRNGMLQITVSDNGEGIAKESLDKVFDMFYRGTNSAQGTGLGLYISREILQKLGASFRLESEKGKGTVFYIDLPLQERPETNSRSGDTQTRLSSESLMPWQKSPNREFSQQ